MDIYIPAALPTAFIFDIELKTIIYNPTARKKQLMPLPGMQYISSFNDKSEMEVSVLAFWNTALNQFGYFVEGQMGHLQTYLDQLQVDYLVGLNSKDFDAEVLVKGEKLTLPNIPHYDIMKEMWAADNVPDGEFNWRIHAGYGLEDTCKANIDLFPAELGVNSEKEMDGANAPWLWQRNEGNDRQSVIDYCCSDVKKTGLLWHAIITTGQLKNPKAERRSLRPILQMARPWASLSAG